MLKAGSGATLVDLSDSLLPVIVISVGVPMGGNDFEDVCVAISTVALLLLEQCSSFCTLKYIDRITRT